MEDVFDGLVAIRECGDDGGVFSAGLGKEVEVSIIAQHGLGGRCAARENDGLDFGTAEQGTALGATRARNELERPFRDPGRKIAQGG